MKKWQSMGQCRRWLCVFLAVICAFCFILPQLHAHDGVQCHVCAHLSELEGLAVVPVIWLCCLVALAQVVLGEAQNGFFFGFSLVGLKVKLSD